MKDKQIILVTACALVDADGSSLVGATPQRQETREGLWEFPGGKVEAGETPEACTCSRTCLKSLGW
jgi:8-oxo-dGTP diphosphatase